MTACKAGLDKSPALHERLGDWWQEKWRWWGQDSWRWEAKQEEDKWRWWEKAKEEDRAAAEVSLKSRETLEMEKKTEMKEKGAGADLDKRSAPVKRNNKGRPAGSGTVSHKRRFAYQEKCRLRDERLAAAAAEGKEKEHEEGGKDKDEDLEKRSSFGPSEAQKKKEAAAESSCSGSLLDTRATKKEALTKGLDEDTPVPSPVPEVKPEMVPPRNKAPRAVVPPREGLTKARLESLDERGPEAEQEQDNRSVKSFQTAGGSAIRYWQEKGTNPKTRVVLDWHDTFEIGYVPAFNLEAAQELQRNGFYLILCSYCGKQREQETRKKLQELRPFEFDRVVFLREPLGPLGKAQAALQMNAGHLVDDRDDICLQKASWYIPSGQRENNTSGPTEAMGPSARWPIS